MYERVLSPITVAGLRIPNRVARASHATGSPWLDRSDDLLAYHQARARGGVGLTILEIGGVHRSSPSAIPIYSDRAIAGLSRLAGMSDAYGMRMFLQLWHGGSAAAVNRTGGPRWSASDIPNVYRQTAPRPMTAAMIEEIRDAFVAAARRAQRSGIHGIELHAGHGYLFTQFLSPLTNRREDEYGGSLENRTRFLREVLAAVRSEVGAAYPVGVRLSADEETPGGLTPADTADIVKLIDGHTDFIDVTLGSYANMAKIMATGDEPLGYQLPKSRIVTAAAAVPTIVTGRIMTLGHAEDIVASGDADMVSMVRALIADPDLVLKAREGHEELIRPCTSSGQGCVARLMVGQQISCVVNVAASAELRIPSDTPQPGPDRKRVVIVGAGLAGLEAARTAALRGHDVTLLEMRSEVGGQALIASMAPGRGDTRAIISWLAQELDRLSVRVKLGTVVDDDLLLGLAPDDVIMATGSAPRRDGRQLDPPGRELPGAQLPHVATSWAVFGFGGSADISGRVLVYDDLAGHEGLAVCDHVAAHGAGLVYVTRHASLASGVDAPETTAMRSIERVLGAGAEVIGYATLLEIGPAQARVRYRGTGRVRTIAADAVVRVGVNEPETGLAGILSDSGLRIQLVGDANGSRDWMSAIHDGHKAALAL